MEEIDMDTEKKFKSNRKTYEEELKKLEMKYNGTLTPKDVVREASKPSSPLHNWFDWNDDSAGEKWRLQQARVLIRYITVKVMFEGGKREYRKYLNVKVENERVYMPTTTIVKKKELKDQILRRAINEAEYWRRTYQDYIELEDIFKGINKTKKKLKKIIAV